MANRNIAKSIAELTFKKLFPQMHSDIKGLQETIKMLYAELSFLTDQVRAVQEDVSILRNNRHRALEDIGEYLAVAQLRGDYCEFGVYKGSTFIRAVKRWSPDPNLAHMRYFAFDSFQGLPPPQGKDAENGYTSNFHGGEFACSQAEFEHNLEVSNVDLSRVRVIPGWFEATLTSAVADEIGLDRIACAWVDGDLYESTVPVLDFLTPRLLVGSVIVFDDWASFRNLPTRGEQLACSEWLLANPQLQLRELGRYSGAMVFTVVEC